MDSNKAKKKRGRGRPNGLNEKMIRQICRLIQLGMTYDVVATANGIKRSTLYDWRKRGEKAKSGLYRKLNEELERAKALMEVALILAIRKQGAEGAKWILQRRWPERWDLRYREKTEAPEPLPWNTYDEGE